MHVTWVSLFSILFLNLITGVDWVAEVSGAELSFWGLVALWHTAVAAVALVLGCARDIRYIFERETTSMR